MIRAIIFAAALAFAGSAAHADIAGLYKVDAKGKCHDHSGKFAKQTMCGAPGASYKLDAKGKCHDAKGKFAKQELCKKP